MWELNAPGYELLVIIILLSSSFVQLIYLTVTL